MRNRDGFTFHRDYWTEVPDEFMSERILNDECLVCERVDGMIPQEGGTR
jgi:hypothetical protein